MQQRSRIPFLPLLLGVSPGQGWQSSVPAHPQLPLPRAALLLWVHLALAEASWVPSCSVPAGRQAGFRVWRALVPAEHLSPSLGCAAGHTDRHWGCRQASGSLLELHLRASAGAGHHQQLLQSGTSKFLEALALCPLQPRKSCSPGCFPACSPQPQVLCAVGPGGHILLLVPSRRPRLERGRQSLHGADGLEDQRGLKGETMT